MSNFVATDVYALFSIHVKKSATLLCKTRGGGEGGQGPFTQCVKKHPIWYPGASLIRPPTLLQHLVQSDAVFFETVGRHNCNHNAGKNYCYKYFFVFYFHNRKAICSLKQSAGIIVTIMQAKLLLEEQFSMFLFIFITAKQNGRLA